MTNRRTGVLVAVVALLVSLPPGALAVQDISVVTNGSLSFGNIVVSGSPGTVAISPTGMRSVSGGVLLGTSAGASPGSLTVLGEPLTSYDIMLPGAALLTGPDDDMIFDNFTSSLGGSGTLNAGGSQTVNFGATLHLKANQGNGAYAGTFSVTVTYE
jgi:hypothetical protein